MIVLQEKKEEKNGVILSGVEKSMLVKNVNWFGEYQRMFSTKVQNNEKSALKFELPFDQPDYYVFAFQKPSFYHCDICKTVLPHIMINAVSSALLCDDCKKEYVTDCGVCGSSMFDYDAITETYDRRELDLSPNLRLKEKYQVFVDGRAKYVCKSCKSHYYTECSFCGTEINKNDAFMPESDYICKDCYNEKYSQCSLCHGMHRKEEILDGVCKNCFKAINSIAPKTLHEYGHKPECVFIAHNAGGMHRYYGTETEIDNGRSQEELKKLLAVFEEIYLKTDASLNRNVGTEIVSHPMDLKYHRTSKIWSKIFKICDKLEYKSHEATKLNGSTGRLEHNCGLHIHTGKNGFGESTRNQQKYIAYFLHLFMKFQKQIEKFSRRDTFVYCQFYNGYNLNEKPTRAYQKYAYYNKSVRNLAVNFWGHKYEIVNGRSKMVVYPLPTVEIRVFRGTLKTNTYLASIELIDALMHLALSVKTDEKLKEITWQNVISLAMSTPEYEELKNYLKTKKLL